MYYPASFQPAARAIIEAHVAPEYRIALDRADAERFAANAVCIGKTIVLSSCSGSLRTILGDRGYAVVETPLHAFLRSGGPGGLPTLRADHCSEAFAQLSDAQTSDRDMRVQAQRRSIRS